MGTVRPYWIKSSPYQFIKNVDIAHGVAFICSKDDRKTIKYKSFGTDFNRDSIIKELKALKSKFDSVTAEPFLYSKEDNHKGSPSGYIVSLSMNGKQSRKKYPGITKSQAQQILHKRETDSTLVNEGLKKDPSSIITLEHLWSIYKKDLKTRGRSQLTVDRARLSYDTFAEVVGRSMRIDKIDRGHIGTYVIKRQETCKDISVNADLRHLRAIFNLAIDSQWIEFNPFSRYKMLKVDHKEPRFFTPVEIKSIIEKIKDDEDLEIFKLYLLTGCRESELLPPKFTWDNVKFNDKPNGKIIINGKGGKVRSLPMSPEILEILTRRFNSGMKYPIDYSKDQIYKKFVKGYFVELGLSDVNFHSIRKTCGALLIKNGVDIYRVSKYLGHSSVSVTEKHYVGLLKDDYQKLTDQMSDIYSKIEKINNPAKK